MASTGCLASEVAHLLRDNNWTDACKLIEKYKKLFDCVFAELQPGHLIPEQLEHNDKILKLAEMMGLPLICTTDSHYLEESERKEHELVLAIQSKKDIYDEDRFFFEASHLMIAEEMLKHFDAKVLENTIKLADMCEYSKFLEFKTHGYRLPKYPLTSTPEYEEWKNKLHYAGEEESFRYCMYLVEQNWAKKLHYTHEDPELEVKYRDRLKIEVETIKTMGFIDYFLIVWDFVDWCKQNNIMTGCGRGSAGGSLLSYLLGITKLDPLKYDLLFSRFLNADRVSLPDIDMDIDKARRDEVKGYLASKYGKDHVASIATFNTMKVRACVKDIVRSLKLGGDRATSFEIADKINKTLENEDDDISYKEAMNIPAFAKLMEEYPEVDKYTKKFENLVRQTGIHAAGVIIGAEPLTDTIPLMVDKNKVVATAYDGATLEKDGFLKIDLLGLKNLTIITDTFNNIEKVRGKKFSGFYTKGIDVFYDEPDATFEQRVGIVSPGKQMASRAFKLLRDGKTNGVFQVEGPTMRELLKGVYANSIEDVAVVLALCRPGPLASGLTAEYGKRKRSGEDREEWYLHPSLKPILGKTYGVVCLDENTPIYIIERGDYIPIKDCKEGMNTISIKENGVAIPKRINKVINNGRRLVYRYSLSNGQRITLTQDHRVKTPRGWMEINKAFQQKLPIAVPHYLSFGNNTYNEDRLRILAYLLGDGALSTSTNISFISHDEALKQKFEEAVVHAFPRTKTYRISGQTEGTEEIKVAKAEEYYTENETRLNWIPNDLLIWLRELGLKYQNEDGGCNSYTKFIPDFVMNLNEELIKKFVAFLWDCDGGIAPSHYFYTTISKQLAEQVFTLLNKLGLCPNYHYRKDGAYAIICYSTEDCKNSFGQFMTASRKDRETRKITHSTQRACYGVFSKDLIREKALGYIEREQISQTAFAKRANIHRCNLFTTTGKYIKQTDFCHRPLAEQIQSIIQDLDLDNLLADDILWYEIRSCEEVGLQQVYDLTIDMDTSNFVANGVFVHNCYQEQCMQIAVQCAGFTEPESDTLRKAIGKKIHSLMMEYKEKFVNGCVKHSGMTKDIAEKVWKLVEEFAAYGFNKSHAVGYAHTTYQTAYLKANYPAEFTGALLSNEADQLKVNSYIREALNSGLKIKPVNINKSTMRYEVEDVKTIRRNLTTLKNVGARAVEDILSKRPYKNMVDFLARTESKRVTSRVIEALIKAGAFDGAFAEEKVQRKTYYDFYDDCRKKIKRFVKRARENDEKAGVPIRTEAEIMKDFPAYDWHNPVNVRSRGGQEYETPVQRFSKDPREEWKASEIVAFESEIYGAPVSFNIFDFHHGAEETFKAGYNPIYRFNQSLDEYNDTDKVYMMFIVQGCVKRSPYKKDPKKFIRRFQVEDRTGEGIITLFHKTYEDDPSAWKNGSTIIARCAVNVFMDRKGLVVDKILKNCGGIDGTM
jgi:DNA polymerase-3 subunit alpha